jgi:hypothetical protein
MIFTVNFHCKNSKVDEIFMIFTANFHYKNFTVNFYYKNPKLNEKFTFRNIFIIKIVKNVKFFITKTDNKH